MAHSATKRRSDCVEFSSSPANTLQVYDQPDRASKSINYQPTSGKEQFWVAKRTADEQWVQLYHAITLFDDLPESAKLGWVSTTVSTPVSVPHTF